MPEPTATVPRTSFDPEAAGVNHQIIEMAVMRGGRRETALARRTDMEDAYGKVTARVPFGFGTCGDPVRVHGSGA